MENLGKLGRDKVTEFEGIIIAKAIHLSGCNTYLLAPKVNKNGKKRPSQYFSAERIEIIGEGISIKAKSKNSDVENAIELGKCGKDRITDFQGIIIAKVINLFGSNSLALEPKAKDGESKNAVLFDEGRIIITDENGISAEEVQSSKPGGVSLKATDNIVF